jgi:hypothetical protein
MGCLGVEYIRYPPIRAASKRSFPHRQGRTPDGNRGGLSGVMYLQCLFPYMGGG